MPSSRADKGRRPGSPASMADPADAGFPDPVAPLSSSPGDDDPHSIINAGDCKVRVNVQIFEHLCDGRIVQLPRRNPRVAVEVDVEVHLHHCPPMRR